MRPTHVRFLCIMHRVFVSTIYIFYLLEICIRQQAAEHNHRGMFFFRHFPHTRMSLTPQRKGNKNDSKSACIIQNWTNCISSIQRQKALISFYFITRFLGRICVAADGTVRRHRYPPLLLQFTLHSRSVGFMCSLMHISCSFSISHKVISYFSCLFLDVLVYFACVFYDICVCAFLSQSLSLSSLCPTTISAPIARDGNSGNHITESKCETSRSEMMRLRFSCFWSLCFCVSAAGSGLHGKIRSYIVQ